MCPAEATAADQNSSRVRSADHQADARSFRWGALYRAQLMVGTPLPAGEPDPAFGPEELELP